MIIRKQKRVNELGAAAHAGDLETVKRLVEKGVPLDRETNIRAPNERFISLPSPNRPRMKPLEVSIHCGNLAISQYLVDNGAKVEKVDIHRAIEDGRLDFLEFLAAKDSDLFGLIQDPVEIVKTGSPRILDIALRRGMDKDALLKATLRHFYSSEGHIREDAKHNKQRVESARYLIEKGATVTREMVMSARQNNPDLADVLGFAQDPEDAKLWRQRQNLIAEGTMEEKARARVEELQDMAKEGCAPVPNNDRQPKEAIACAEKRQESAAEIRAVAEQLEQGLRVLQQSPAVDFNYAVMRDKEGLPYAISTNIEGERAPLQISIYFPKRVYVYSGDGKWDRNMYSLHHGFSYHAELNPLEFSTPEAVIDHVIKEAFAKNAVKPSTDAKLAAQTAKQATEKPGGNAP